MEGWIPREQILGVEARAKVPGKFLVQENHIANPPSLFLTIQNFLADESYGTTIFLEKIYPRLESWFNWLHKNQKGGESTTYYWRGRNSTTDTELIPKTPASGLDDYPRASHPSPDERHLDFRCWMALASNVLANIGKRLGKNIHRFKVISQELFDSTLLEKYHWNQEQKSFNDFGLHTNAVELDHKNWTRIVYREPKLKFLESFGYVSLYPLMLRILEPDSLQLSNILSDVTNKELLWTDYGLRSLAKNSPFYQVWNTKDDPPYWRGSVWINLNYLTLSGLYHYANIPGLHKKMARDVYNQLRVNLVNNMLKQYRETGFVFEYYDDTTGVGKGVHPFNSWSSLVVNIIAEKY
ncbi:mannosyl-oligosaccharide glucosidase-like [Saccostrea echinata]|uniref:mannosyl-oligosaccharide glucosidase-like n=1 Tax=Saccostrea echinata TaxID=191078 RepID=UPI002A82F5F1|nr:mannosyl-oligosaccharide glucosidase-like [Saccostrea echinata]